MKPTHCYDSLRLKALTSTLLSLMLISNVSFAFRPSPEDEQIACEDAGQTWDDCGSACGPECVNSDGSLGDFSDACIDLCVPQCDCDDGLWDGFACQPASSLLPLCPGQEEPITSVDERICIEGGGVWNECGSDCPDECMDANGEIHPVSVNCPAVCVEQCECPSGQLFIVGWKFKFIQLRRSYCIRILLAKS